MNPELAHRFGDKTMATYCVDGASVQVPTEFLTQLKKDQIQPVRGCYGWYIHCRDLQKLGITFASSDPTEIFLYVGTIGEGCTASITSRFLGELCGPQVSTDQGQKFDTDFVMSAVLAFLGEKSVDVCFTLLSERTGTDEEVGLAKQKRPVLQKVTGRRVVLHSDLKRKIGDNMQTAYDKMLQAVLRRLRERAAESG